MERVFESSLASSTWKTYRAAQEDFRKFCSSINQSPIPASEELLILYTAHLSTRLAHSSIRTYLSAVRNLHVLQGKGDPMAGRLKLDQFLRGVRRLKSRPADSRLPVTPLILSAIRRVLDRQPSSPDHIMLWAACCLGFFGFLRSGEFTVPSLTAFDPSIHLTPNDVTTDSRVNPTMVFVRIKASKCDQTKQGVTVCVGRTDTQLCPVAAILAYCVVRGTSPGPFFRLSDQAPLTKQRLITMLRSTLETAGIEASRYSGHSFRIGAATSAAACGLADSTIQTLGRWSSDSFKRYIRIPPQDLATMSKSLILC